MMLLALVVVVGFAGLMAFRSSAARGGSGASSGTVVLGQARETIDDGARTYRFHCSPGACEQSRRLDGRQFVLPAGTQPLPFRCGRIDCGCHCRIID